MWHYEYLAHTLSSENGRLFSYAFIKYFNESTRCLDPIFSQILF